MLQTGAQLYTVRSYTQTIEDFICTIQKIADIGYKAVQLSAVSKQIKPEQIREICDRAGISIVLTHSDPERILHDTDALIKEHRYGVVLRAQGLEPATDGGWIHFDYVPGESDVRRGSAQVTGRVCVIGSHLAEDALKELFHIG